MRVSVVIPNLNSPIIGAVLHALYEQQTPPYEIIIVGRDDQRFIPLHPLVRFIETPKPVSAAVARNNGAALACGDIICFIDADCLAHPYCLQQHIHSHKQGEVVVGGGIALHNDNYWQLCDNLAVFAPFLTTQPRGERPYLPSLNLSIRRSLFLDLGGFDERFTGASGEDTDLSFRIRRRHYRLFFEPSASVEHRHRRLTSGDVWRHLSSFGRSYASIYPRYPELTGQLRRTGVTFGRPDLLRSIAPLLAVIDCAERWLRYPELRSYPHILPGLFWSRLAWYDGMANGMQLR